MRRDIRAPALSYTVCVVVHVVACGRVWWRFFHCSLGSSARIFALLFSFFLLFFLFLVFFAFLFLPFFNVFLFLAVLFSFLIFIFFIFFVFLKSPLVFFLGVVVGPSSRGWPSLLGVGVVQLCVVIITIIEC